MTARSWGSAALAGRDGFRFDGLAPGPKRLELWLPQFAPFRLYDLDLSPGATVAPPDPAPRPRWITYGSSLAAAYPPMAQAKSKLDGAGGAGAGPGPHGTRLPRRLPPGPRVARLIRDLPTDYLSMEVALNALLHSTLSPRTYAPAVIGFVCTVRDGHPDIPIVVPSPIYVPRFDDPASPGAQPNAVGLTLPAMRAETAAAVERLRAHGDRRVHYVDGLRLYGAEQAHLSPDGVHPERRGRTRSPGFLREVVTPISPDLPGNR